MIWGNVIEAVVVPSISVHKLNTITVQSEEGIASNSAVITEMILNSTDPEVLIVNKLFDSSIPPDICLI